VSIGANATIGPGLTLGEFSMVGMGSVVTKDVPAHALVLGNPARVAGWLCACGHPLVRGRGGAPVPPEMRCDRCRRDYVREGEGIRPTKPIASAP
jgi:UDP-2-acetamido-3-amino-2,3-dideoxy-glucuronate N-acetyltransferase